MKKITICDSCPCYNNDYENGYECNLDFIQKYEKINGKWTLYSENCQLGYINNIDPTKPKLYRAVIMETKND